jgi:hypothetical protein
LNRCVFNICSVPVKWVGNSETEERDGGCGDGVAEKTMVCPCRRRWWLQNDILLVGL